MIISIHKTFPKKISRQQTSKMKLQYFEHVNVDRCRQVLAMTRGQIKETFWDKNEVSKDGHDFDWVSYIARLRRYLQFAISQNGAYDREYKFAENHNDGRIYVKDYGIQSLQKNLRNFLCDEYYYDIDIANAHPCILLHLCKEHGVYTPYLENYVLDRQNVLCQNKLFKKDILVAINKDNNKEKPKNKWYNAFIAELTNIKQSLHPVVEAYGFKTRNTTNPISSLINKCMCSLENKIIQQTVEFFGDCAEVPMFDGLMVSKDYCPPDMIQNTIESLNELFVQEYHDLIKFDLKPTRSDVLVDSALDGESYEAVKTKFELEHFQTMNPFRFWKSYITVDGSVAYTQLSTHDFKTVCKEFVITDINKDGKMYETDIYDKWIADKTRRVYQCVDFIPFHNENTCPPHVFNTFDGYAITNDVTKSTEPTQLVDISGFTDLLLNLCGHDDAMCEYFTKYLAHIIQYPNRRTEKVIVIKSWPGAGKDTLHRTLDRLLGQKHVDVTEDPQKIFGNFNGIMDSKLCLFMNEMEGKDGIQFQERIKAQATNLKNKINRKHDKELMQNNYCRLFISSNNDGCVNVQNNDRRYVIMNASYDLCKSNKDESRNKKVNQFWETYYTNLNDINWRYSVYKYLADMDISEFNPSKAPENVAKQLMKEKNIHPLYYFLEHVIEKQQPDIFIKKTIKGIEWHLFKFYDFVKAFMSYVEEDLGLTDYKMKQAAIKIKLDSMQGGCYRNDQVYRIKQNGVETRSRMCGLDLKTTSTFLKEFIFTTDEAKEIFLGEVTMPSTGTVPNLSSSFCL